MMLFTCTPQYNLLQNTMLPKLRNAGEPIATVKAVHTGPNASKASSEDASKLEPVICLAYGARVMFTSNLWTDAGLVNGATGTVQAICYQSGAFL